MKNLLIILLVVFTTSMATAQTDTLRLNLGFSPVDLPQELEGYDPMPTMQQALEAGNDLYDVSFWGIHTLADLILPQQTASATKRIYHTAFEYVAGFAFSKYGSELPIPLGVWTHEEWHRSVLGVNGLPSKNGNWILNRWDGTVYGMSDAALNDLKLREPAALLYAYTAGIQSENAFTKTNVIGDTWQPRVFYKNALYLYNAYYVFDYFNFSLGALSDSVKVIAPDFESTDPAERDFAGADLTAWVYDMFSPGVPFTNRDSFPNGEGVNRRVGFSDLSPEGQDFLLRQKQLSVLNFLNPAIFLVNRIHITQTVSLNVFMQFTPTPFGNDVSLNVPFNLKTGHYFAGLHSYNNYKNHFGGIELGVSEASFFPNHSLSTDILFDAWSQPEEQDFFAEKGRFGGALILNEQYALNDFWKLHLQLGYKLNGWMSGDPYLYDHGIVSAGIRYVLPAKAD